MKRELNQRQQKFADFMAATGNQTESAVMAGYSPERAHVTGSELVRNRKVYEAIIRSRGWVEEELGIDPLWCARKYVDLSKSAEQAGNFTTLEGAWISWQNLWNGYLRKKQSQEEMNLE